MSICLARMASKDPTMLCVQISSQTQKGVGIRWPPSKSGISGSWRLASTNVSSSPCWFAIALPCSIDVTKEMSGFCVGPASEVCRFVGCPNQCWDTIWSFACTLYPPPPQVNSWLLYFARAQVPADCFLVSGNPIGGTETDSSQSQRPERLLVSPREVKKRPILMTQMNSRWSLPPLLESRWSPLPSHVSTLRHPHVVGRYLR